MEEITMIKMKTKPGKRGPTMADHALRFMFQLKKEAFQREVSVFRLGNRCKQYARSNNVDPNWLMHSIMTKGWVEVSAADTYIIRMDLVK